MTSDLRATQTDTCLCVCLCVCVCVCQSSPWLFMESSGYWAESRGYFYQAAHYVTDTLLNRDANQLPDTINPEFVKVRR